VAIPESTFSEALVGFVGTGCQKSDLNFKNTAKSLDIAFFDTPQKTFSVSGIYLKICFAVLRIRGCRHRLSSSIRSRVIVVHNFKSHDRAFAGHKGAELTPIAFENILTKVRLLYVVCVFKNVNFLAL